MSDSSSDATRAELENLRSEVERLRREVEAVRHRPGTSLKSHSLCPLCGGRSVLHVSEIRDHNYGSSHAPMSVQIVGIIRERGLGVFEAYICRACELTEWYVKGAGDIEPEKLDKENRKNVRIVDGKPPADGVFR